MLSADCQLRTSIQTCLASAMAPFKRRTQEGACLGPGVLSHIPGLGFSACDGLPGFGLIIACALMRSVTGNGVFNSKADALLVGPSSICIYRRGPTKPGSRPQVAQ